MYVAADAQEIIGSELLEPLGMGAANSSDDGQVCPPSPPPSSIGPLQTPIAPLCPSLMLRLAVDAQEIIRSELLEPGGKGAAKGEEEDHGSTLARSTRAAMKKVCLLWQIIVYSIYG